MTPAELRKIADTLEAGGTVDGAAAAVVLEIMFNSSTRRMTNKKIIKLIRERANLLGGGDG